MKKSKNSVVAFVKKPLVGMINYKNTSKLFMTKSKNSVVAFVKKPLVGMNIYNDTSKLFMEL